MLSFTWEFLKEHTIFQREHAPEPIFLFGNVRTVIKCIFFVRGSPVKIDVLTFYCRVHVNRLSTWLSLVPRPIFYLKRFPLSLSSINSPLPSRCPHLKSNKKLKKKKKKETKLGLRFGIDCLLPCCRSRCR